MCTRTSIRITRIEAPEIEFMHARTYTRLKKMETPEINFTHNMESKLMIVMIVYN